MHFHCLLQAFVLLLRESSPRGKVLSDKDVLFVELVPADPPPRQARCTICLVQAAHEKGEDLFRLAMAREGRPRPSS